MDTQPRRHAAAQAPARPRARPRQAARPRRGALSAVLSADLGDTTGVRALLQRVSSASVDVDERTVAQIGPGFLVLLGITHADSTAQDDKLAEKVRALSSFNGADGWINESLGGRKILCVSQFTLYGDARKGN